MPVPRIHNGDVGIAKFPWNCPEETRELYRQCLTERYMLTPYIYSYAIYSHLTGQPILRPLVYHHMTDERVYSVGDEFYMGDHILVAPVTKKGAAGREVYLPEGEWVNYWTGEEHKGQRTVSVDAPLLEKCGLPMFVKKGGAVVKQKPSLTLCADVTQTLFIEFFPDTRSELVLYEAKNIANRFSLENGRVYLENNTDTDREYVVRAYGRERTFAARAGQAVEEDF